MFRATTRELFERATRIELAFSAWKLANRISANYNDVLWQ